MYLPNQASEATFEVWWKRVRMPSAAAINQRSLEQYVSRSAAWEGLQMPPLGSLAYTLCNQ